jgi:thiol:disulfide interchange protein DsbD
MRVTRSISIDESELTERFILASGPGGQNVNKVATAVELRFDVVPGYHLYRERFNARAEPADVVLGELQIPRGLPDFDIALNKQVEIFKNAVTLILPLTQAPQSEFKLIVGNQGCADKGLCYPPMERALKLTPTAAGWTISAMTEAQAEAWKPGLSDSATATEQTGRYAAALQSRSLLAVAGLFLLAGLLLSLTPCVLPLIPILSANLVGHSGKVSRARGFSLALAYSLGMALVYTAFGMAAGLAGEGLAAALQNAWVLGAFALLLAGLSLSMFGVYELQLPSAMQNRLTEMSGRLKGGQHLGVLLMGGLSALIVGPCVAAPLAGALVYISQTKDVLLGGLALFSMACGMSVPLLLVGLSAGTLLPRAGGWMERVKHFFGVMLLAVALWMVSPVLPAWALIAVAALLLLACAVYLGAFERMEAVTPGRALTKAGGLALAALAGLQLVGLVSGGTSLMQPLQHLVSSGKTGLPAFEANELKFERVADLASLQQVVSQSSQPVLLDFYADWCVACKEFEALTLSDPAVRRQLAGFKLLRADVTANSSADKELLRKYALFGPPAILFMKQDGLELASHRVIGFQDAAAFTQHLLNLMPRLQAAPTKL